MLALRLAPVERCLFIGDAAAAKTICSKLTGHGGVKAEVVAQLDADEVAFWTADALSADRLPEISDLAQHVDVHRAIIAPGRTERGEMLDLVRTLKAVGVRVSVLPRVLEVVGSSVEFDDLHGVTMMGVRRFELTRSSAAVKRAFDIVGASLALVVFAPLMVLIALAIRLDGRGPVFFRQLRVGQDGERFRMFKFRTMVRDADGLKDSLRELNEAQEGLFKIERDPRITRVGRVLRKCALDELPQLFDVLRGEMSLVGPRPAGPRRGRAHPRLVSPASGADARDDRPLADPRPLPCSAAGDGRDRLPLRGQLVAVGRRQDPAAHRIPRRRATRALRGIGDGRSISAGGHATCRQHHHDRREPDER